LISRRDSVAVTVRLVSGNDKAKAAESRPAPGIMNPGWSGSRRLLSCPLGLALAPVSNRTRDDLDAAMKTQGEIEAGICEAMTQFEQEFMGRAPREIHAHVIGDLRLVRLQGVLTAAEQQLIKTLPTEKGRNLLKEVRTQLMETARPVLEALVQEVSGVKVLSLHHDISTVTGEEVVLFTLAESPHYREAKRK
jgi:uncharacterized protein YbcI